MSELLPGIQAPAVQDGILDYLSTTFALADEEARVALVDFLANRENGIFKGPYLRVRLPFKAADEGWRDTLEWYEGFTPYGHQAAAFARLSSFDLGEPRSRPLPTLVTTGTGSGKTESFLYPIIDHVVRARRRGIAGTKALILYPMNALANDQAQRLAALLSAHEELAGVTAAIFTGEQGPQRSKVSKDGLITRREVIRSDPPDILLTNYKMLDQMLLREADARIWEKSATSLQYLVLDEFHTYDGAQGTDVSMLLRRLGLALKSYWSADAFTEIERARPLGIITPVATSATLGDKGDPEAMLDFARTVFGEEFDESSVVTEARLTVDEWKGHAARIEPRVDHEAVKNAVERASGLTDGRAIAEAVLGRLFVTTAGGSPVLTRATPEELLTLAKAHPFTHALTGLAERACPISELAEHLLPTFVTDEQSRQTAETFVLLFCAALSHVRKVAGRAALSIDLHLWVRELTRIDRVAVGSPQYLWSDDTHLGDSALDAEGIGAPAFPAVFCRHCGRSGWAVLRAPVGGFDLTAAESNDIRLARLTDDQEFRVLIHAPAEAEAANSGDRSGQHNPDEPRLSWFHTTERRVFAERPEDDAEVAASRVLPVLAHTGPLAGSLSVNDTCPSCMQKDGIRFLGSAIATLLSVALSTIFGSNELDKGEKKALIFTDSVQDAAHRAGFIQSRSHSLTLRAVLRGAVGDALVSLDVLVDRALQQAGDDSHLRYRLIPPDFADRTQFEAFWRREKQSQVPAAVRRRVKRRLVLDTVLEFGLQSRVGRTLELTGSLAAEVDISRAVMLKVATEVEKAVGPEHFEGMGLTDDQRIGWVRGVVERMRTDGAIEHEWFRKYQVEDGRRYSIWGGRPRSDGMPAFPRGRGAPAYPRAGGGGGVRDSDLVSVGSSQSWYAVWTARVLTCTPHEGASLSVALLNQLAALDVIKTVNTNSGGQVYELPQSGVLVGPVEDEGYRRGRYLLACDVCGAEVPGTNRVVEELDGLPCFVARCNGTLIRAVGQPDNFYRQLYQAFDITRVVAREHTSLLDDLIRLNYETQFKSSSRNPQAPNVLVATPTLEMGIDIGDLSTVMLASLPRSVASYLQRVGRAGRLTGSALNLAFVSGRGEQLPRLGDPLSVVNGQVRPPATYIDAEEILRRQYLASVADQLARSVDAPHPTSATQAIGSVDPESFLRALIEGAESPASLEAFLSSLDTLTEQARSRLKQWATPVSGPLSSQLSVHLHARRHHWAGEVETLKHRIREIQTSLPELQERAALPAATEDDKVAFRTARAALRLARKQLADLQGDYWIGVLEEQGIFPNYTLLDDSVTLDVTLSWIDPDTQEYMSEPATFNRGASAALREFAPGATFYARGYKIQIDAVDLGSEGEAIHSWVFCPSCGYGRPLDGGSRPTACPRCGDPAISDVRQIIDVVELERVSSAMRREEAAIDDGRDERERTSFQIVTAADVDEPRHQWFIENYPFGLKHLTNMTIRWLNVGKLSDPGAGPRVLSGEEYAAPLFRVCSGCGKVDSRTGQNSAAEHRPWCGYRNTTQESIRRVALARTLRTEAVVIQLPATISIGDRFAVPSLLAALQLGLREHLGGAPDHLAFEKIVDPYLSDGTENRDAILIHDTVPGGTGYLAELADPARFYALLFRAWILVRDCPCKDEGRASCHRCLSPFINSFTQKHVSRVAAERHLRTILLAGASEGAPAGRLSWEVTEKQTSAYDPETHIEQKFRKLLHKRLIEGLGASVLEQPGPNGNRWTINPGGDRTWVMEPQLALGAVKPDFVFYSNDQNVPRLALFCDGWQFHASPVINRIADDAAKRAALRDQGYVVLGLTWQDLVDAEAGTSAPPQWFSEARWPQVVTATNGKLKPGLLDIVRGGPIDFLVQWISRPDPDGIAALAEAVPLLLAGSGQVGKASGAENLADLARSAHDTAVLPMAGDRRVWMWRHNTVTAVARNIAAQGNGTEVVVILDDRDDRLGQDHKHAWREWIRLANLLNRRDQPYEVTAYSLATAPTAKTASGSVELPEPWSALYRSAVSEAEKSMIAQLAKTDAPAPELGFETASGLPIDISWPALRVAVNLHLEQEDRDELAEDGWTLVEAEPEAILHVLATVGGR
ncbi:DEAD/DEAH box helicase [Lentzea sp. BCCO 10_0061]|uniref:DEAD/DEAH box helicase n=1 Tax=Lentzea sokolovensis TaxID=3095429 RepID=A0ABU4V0J5_9PSEU|nr:DEAD/DEAH box helicase [Lentzea sp. BCCO 10_0061]MDX8145020.1 DEAD/DEAH box helicase [Lentzea sp. BCCO 10_0061]